jgi:hypothetical protein
MFFVNVYIKVCNALQMKTFGVLGKSFPLWEGWKIQGKSDEEVKIVSSDGLHEFCDHHHDLKTLTSFLSNEWKLGKSLCPIGDKICDTEECWLKEGRKSIKLEYTPPNETIKSKFGVTKLKVISVSFFRPYERNGKDYFYYDFLYHYVQLLFQIFDRSEWILRVYIDNSLESNDYQSPVDKQSESALYKNLLTYLLIDKNVQIVKVTMPDLLHEKSKDHHKGLVMTIARYFAVFDKDVEITLCRDIDNLPSLVDKQIINDWSEKTSSTGVLLYLTPRYSGSFLKIGNLFELGRKYNEMGDIENFKLFTAYASFFGKYGAINAGLTSFKNFNDETLFWNMMSLVLEGKFHIGEKITWEYGIDERMLNFFLLGHLFKSIELFTEVDEDDFMQIDAKYEMHDYLTIKRLLDSEEVFFPLVEARNIHAILRNTLAESSIDPTQFEFDYMFATYFKSKITLLNNAASREQHYFGLNMKQIITKLGDVNINNWLSNLDPKERLTTLLHLFGAESARDYITWEPFTASPESNEFLGLPLYLIMNYLREMNVVPKDCIVWSELVGQFQTKKQLLSSSKKKFNPDPLDTRLMPVFYDKQTIFHLTREYDNSVSRVRKAIKGKENIYYVSGYIFFKQLRVDLGNGRIFDTNDLKQRVDVFIKTLLQ